VRIGVTGHQRLADPSGWPWVQDSIDAIIAQATRPLVGVTSLAAGADQIFARAVLRHGGEIEVVVPFFGYAAKFQISAEQEAYFRLLEAASWVEVLGGEGSDQERYLRAGQKVVDSSDLLIAIWDGQPAAGLGGTGDIVEYAATKGTPISHINPVARVVRSLA